MSQVVNFKTKDGRQHAPSIDSFPNECPLCHKSCHPSYMGSGVKSSPQESILETGAELIFQCPACFELFIGYYNAPDILVDKNLYLLRETKPQKFVPNVFPPSIGEISPDFVNLFNEASGAETAGFLKICGAGYRKALEFLIKDYSIETGVDPALVKGKLLGGVISSYISDPRIKAAAQKAAWLGNDETHYERVWEDKDLEDLKKLIHLTVNFIDSEVVAKSYDVDMSGGGKAS